MADIATLAKDISGLTLKEAVELSKVLEEEYGIEPAKGGGGVMMAAAADGPAAAEEKTDFDLILAAAGDQKIKVIKVVREIAGLGLKEAKELVDNAPKALLEKKPKEEIEEAKKKLEEVGASCEVK